MLWSRTSKTRKTPPYHHSFDLKTSPLTLLVSRSRDADTPRDLDRQNQQLLLNCLGSRELGDRRDRSLMESTIGSFPTECKQKMQVSKSSKKLTKKKPSVNLTNWRMVGESHHECIDVVCQPTMGSLPKENVALESFAIYLDTRNLSKQIWRGPQKAETYVIMCI